LGYTNDIDELMAVADVVISKPGGLTSAEVLARGSVLATVNPIPGQESRNSDYLLENWSAVKIGPVATLPYKNGALLNDPKRLSRLKTNARRLGRPRAAFAAAVKVLAMIKPQTPAALIMSGLAALRGMGALLRPYAGGRLILV
jgi:processive 1,2-diacylglycerol beta-glucosyltransferase